MPHRSFRQAGYVAFAAIPVRRPAIARVDAAKLAVDAARQVTDQHVLGIEREVLAQREPREIVVEQDAPQVRVPDEENPNIS